MMRAGTLITIVLTLVMVSSIPMASTDDNIQIVQIYTIRNYGNLVVAAINRSALTYLDNGYWLLVLPNIDAVTFSSELVKEIIGKFIGSRTLYSRLHITMADDGYRTAKTINTLNASDASDDEIMNAIMQALNASRAREALVSFLEGKVIRIDVVAENGLDIEKIAKKLSDIAKNHKVVVIETMGIGVPSYFDARDLYENLKKISCFVRVGESLYGVDIWFDISCIKKLAIATNRSLNEVVEDAINSVKALDPLIRKYLPYQDIVILVAQPPPPAIPLPGELKPVEKIEHTETVEISQTPSVYTTTVAAAETATVTESSTWVPTTTLPTTSIVASPYTNTFTTTEKLVYTTYPTAYSYTPCITASGILALIAVSLLIALLKRK
ncbi:MAG: hypothetical protein QXT53_00735 [Ignisphaera sp.]